MKKLLLYSVFFGNLAVIGTLWWLNSGPLLMSGNSSNEFIAIGRIIGLLAEYFILVQLVLIGRIRFIEQMFGFDKMNKIHRTIGYCLACFVIFHPLLITTGYALSSQVSLWSQFLNFLYNWEDVFKAFLGLTLLLCLVAISISVVRHRLKYETWYFSHIFMYVAIFLFFGHQLNTGDLAQSNWFIYWYTLNFTIFGLVLLYRFLRPLYLAYKYQFFIEKVVKENNLITSIYISGKNLETYRFKAGQYVHVMFLKRGMWYAHPFSLSAAPNGKYLRLSIKNSGDFTQEIYKLTPGTKMIVDGPFGVFTEASARTKKFLFIAAGIGITPIYSLIESMSAKKTDMILLYGNRTLSETAFIPELQKLQVKIIGFLSQEHQDTYQFGRIDKEKIAQFVPDVKERDVYICGPDEMMVETIKNLQAIGVPKAQIHFERFGY